MKRVLLVVFVAISAIVILTIIVFNYVLFPKRYSEFVYKYSEEYLIESSLVFAIIKAESNFKASAVSSAGAVGLMQIMPQTAEWIAGKLGLNYEINLTDPETNINFGCFYLKYLYSRFSDLSSVIAAYNAGETAVASWLDENGNLLEDNIKYLETKSYLKRVLKNYKFYNLKEM